MQACTIITCSAFVYAFEIASYLDKSKQRSPPSPGYLQTPNSADKKKLLNWNSYQNCSKFDSFHPHTLSVCFCRFRLLSLEKNKFFYRGSGQKLRKQLRSDDGDFMVPFKFANNNNSAIKNSLTQNYSLTSNYKFLNFWEFSVFVFQKHSRISFSFISRLNCFFRSLWMLRNGKISMFYQMFSFKNSFYF